MSSNRKTPKLRERLTDYQKNQREKKKRERRRRAKILDGVKRDKLRKWS